MRKTITTILILILVVAGGIFLFSSSPENSNQAPEKSNPEETGPKEQDKITPEKELEIKVMDHLESSVLEPEAEQGRIFADYHQFGQAGNKVFIWGYIAEYQQEKGELKLGSALSNPMVITVDEDQKIQDHWQPRDGAEYTDSIKEKFPSKYQEDALNFQTRHKDILQNLKRSLRQRAEKEMIPEQFDKVLKVGETATITLEANRTTGYQWSHNIADQEILEIISDEYQETEQDQDVVGAGGTRIVEIKGVKEGTTTVELEYSREWESKPPKKRRDISIKVEKDEKGSNTKIE